MAQKQLNLSPEAIMALIEALSVLNVARVYLVVITPIYTDYSPQLLVMRLPLHLHLPHRPTTLMVLPVLQSQQPTPPLHLRHSKPLRGRVPWEVCYSICLPENIAHCAFYLVSAPSALSAARPLSPLF